MRLPLLAWKAYINNLEIWHNSWARVETYTYLPQFNILFDVGKCPDYLIFSKKLFLTHIHLDHSLGIFYYIAMRKVMHLPKAHIYLPEQSLEDALTAIDSIAKMERTSYPFELYGLKPGQKIELNKKFFITTFKTWHSIDSLGYHLWERKSKLKPEFKNLSSSEIANLVKQGVNVSEEQNLLLFSLTGDTNKKIFETEPLIFKTPILLIECTYFNKPDKAYERGHIDFEDLMNYIHNFSDNTKIIISHFSLRYKPYDIKNFFQQLSPELKSKIIPAIGHIY